MEQDKCILREMNCELNQLSMPDGSTIFMQGDTCIAAGVYGPIEARLAKMMYDKAHIEVVFSPIKGPPSIDGRMKELYIKETCESTIMISLHPGTAISINLQEMEDAGGLLACAINAANLALINSSLSMKFTIAAIHCMIDKDSGKIILDPEPNQLQNARAKFTYAFDSIKKDLITCHTSGIFTEKELMISMKQCREASQYIFNFYREVVKKYSKCTAR
ncbi:exosome complex component RRP46 [Diachasma alloeum]|uniref:exosome complex component RRP46 n=1 Tax=Diachasma alloeum TaxID=454923 RepID=UPI0007384DDA|nr:exosome complex component RRP46 [Diachasma alloeum]